MLHVKICGEVILTLNHLDSNHLNQFYYQSYAFSMYF